jgi:hypothetical protein
VEAAPDQRRPRTPEVAGLGFELGRGRGVKKKLRAHDTDKRIQALSSPAKFLKRRRIMCKI